MLSKICEICTVSFSVKNDKRGLKKKTCSKSCASKLAARNNQKIFKCRVCGATYLRYKLSSNLLCDKHLNMADYRDGVCVICGSAFFRRRGTLCCSQKCTTLLNKQSLVVAICAVCDKDFTLPGFINAKNKRQFCSDVCRRKNYNTFYGQRYDRSWFIVRKRILERDDYRCLRCLSTEFLEVHHFIKFSSFDKPSEAHFEDNLGTFCRGCHKYLENLGIRSLTDYESIKDIV